MVYITWKNEHILVKVGLLLRVRVEGEDTLILRGASLALANWLVEGGNPVVKW